MQSSLVGLERAQPVYIPVRIFQSKTHFDPVKRQALRIYSWAFGMPMVNG